MSLKFNSAVFGSKVKINSSGEAGVVTGYAQHQRSKGKQFFVEYVTGIGTYKESWFFEDQLTLIAA